MNDKVEERIDEILSSFMGDVQSFKKALMRAYFLGHDEAWIEIRAMQRAIMEKESKLLGQQNEQT